MWWAQHPETQTTHDVIIPGTPPSSGHHRQDGRAHWGDGASPKVNNNTTSAPLPPPLTGGGLGGPGGRTSTPGGTFSHSSLSCARRKAEQTTFNHNISGRAAADNRPAPAVYDTYEGRQVRPGKLESLEKGCRRGA